MRGATKQGQSIIRHYQFQSTLPVRGATIYRFPPDHNHARISIHAPRAGSDYSFVCRAAYQRDFNPRSPCGERLSCVIRCKFIRDFNPRSPCGERPELSRNLKSYKEFQSTLPVRGATRDSSAASDAFLSFQSTLPVRGATVKIRIFIRIFK